MIREKAGNSVDVAKAVACVLIVGSHCLPIFKSEIMNYYYSQWLFRFCVPFFFISTGFFFGGMDAERKKKYIIRIAVLYLISSILYLPLSLHGSKTLAVKYLIFGVRHLWYLSALTVGLILAVLSERILKNRRFIIASLLLLGGVLLDEYYKLLNVSFIKELANGIEFIGGARNGLFFALPMILLGEYIGEINGNLEERINELRRNDRKTYILAFIGLLFLSFLEASILRRYISEDITLDLSLFGWMPAIPLLLLMLSYKSFLTYEQSRKLRKIVDYVYIIHIWVAVITERYLDLKYSMKFLLVLVISVVVSCVYAAIKNRIGKHIGLGVQ